MTTDCAAITHKALSPSRIALKALPIAFLTFAVADWMPAMLGTGKLQAIIITFSWVIASGEELLTAAGPNGRFPIFPSSFDQNIRTLGGQIVWWGLPWLQASYPGAWFSTPVAVSSPLIVIGAMLAVCWPPCLFLGRRRHGPAFGSEIAGPVLYFSFFLLSGHLAFGAIACLACTSLVATYPAIMRWTLRPDLSGVPVGIHTVEVAHNAS